MIKFIKLKLDENKKKKIEAEQHEQDRIYQIEKKFTDELKNKFIKDSLCVSIVGLNLCSMHKFVIQAMNKLDTNISEDIMYKNFIEIYKIVESVNTINEFESNLQKQELINIYEKNFGQYIDTRDSKFISNMYDHLEHDKFDELILEECLCAGGRGAELAIDLVKECLSGKAEYEYGRLSIAWISLMYAKALNKTLILLKYKEPFINNKELYSISTNLYNEFHNYKLVCEKLYPIYEEFYKGAFDEDLSYRHLAIISDLINKDVKYSESELEYKVNELIKKIDNLDNTNVTYLELDKIIIKLVEMDYSLIEEKSTIFCLYLNLINIYMKNISIENLINIYSKKDDISKKLDEYRKEKKLKDERKRFLNGDFSKERELEREKHSFENIKTGEEFELYLKMLFNKLGYDVELTKTSGDQGADLILLKNRVKTVVQAKFYSNPVGNKAVQEVVGAIKYYKADKGMVVTNSTYTKSALELADANNVELIDGDILEDLKQKIFATN